MVRIDIDPEAGFCFGVEKVIGTAESLLENGEPVYGLGEMVHNSGEMERLHRLGLRTLTLEEVRSIKPARVLFRAHGEPPSTYQWARENRVEIIDGTCPIVMRLQKKIRKTYLGMDRSSERIVIYGKREHPETIGLLGQVDGDAVVIGTPEEAKKIEPGKSIYLFSQTTMDPERFKEIEQVLKDRLKDHGPRINLRSECTICGQMKRRKPGLSLFVMNHKVILFVSGKNSSNGKMLFEFSLSLNPNTHWISYPDEIHPEWLENSSSIGITGATSTSRKQLESVHSRVKKLTSG